jgi:hypothetical protein
METTDFTISLLVEQTPEQALNATNNVPDWWTKDFEGRTEKVNDIFTVRFGEVFITSKVVELIPGKKAVWLVTDCNKPWLKNKKEWVDTKMSWEISEKDNKTELRFTHLGLVPEIECFGVCSKAWTGYLRKSLWSLITTGIGQPDSKN